MSIGTTKRPTRVVLDTNIIISAIGFGHKPREILQLTIKKQVLAVTSPILLAELEDTVHKKFPSLARDFDRVTKKIKRIFITVQPKETLKILQDEADNRVLEAATEGKCKYIITGDKELLGLEKFRNTYIVTVKQFLEIYDFEV